MNKNRPFLLQLIIVGGFLIFLYVFFALATSIYRDYKLEVNIEKFENTVARLAQLAQQKPDDVKYYQSQQYKDQYAKENLNLLNPGEKLIIIPKDDKIVKSEIVAENTIKPDVLKSPNNSQWWEYFFGNTLSVPTGQPTPKNTNSQDDDLSKRIIKKET